MSGPRTHMKHQEAECGFTLVELMTVLLIIGVLLTAAIPVYGLARAGAERRACHASGRIVEGAYRTYEAEYGPDAAAALTDWDELMAVLLPLYTMSEPICPAGGVYQWTDEEVLCSKHGHYQ